MNAFYGTIEWQKFCLCNVLCEVVRYCLTAGKISCGRLARTGLDEGMNGRGLLSHSLWETNRFSELAKNVI